jgi:serine protease inhibitor
MGGPPDYEDVDFVLDKPFIFAITDANGEILFMGCVYTV